MTRKAPFWSARARILVTILSVAFVGLALAGSVTFLSERERVLNGIDERLRTQVSTLDLQIEQDALSATSPSAGAAADQLRLRDFSDLETFLVAAIARTVSAPTEGALALLNDVPIGLPDTRRGLDLADDPAFVSGVVATSAAPDIPRLRSLTTDRTSYRYYAVTVALPGSDDIGVYVRAIDVGAELAPVGRSSLTFSIAAIATLIGAGIAGWFVVGRLLSPIRDLGEAADTITLADLRARVPSHGSTDLAEVTRTVNEMLDRLESSVDVQRQLLDDVRHELKTPITIIRGHLEMMDAHDPSDVRSTTLIAVSELDRMTRLVEDIDLLASVDNAQYARAPVDLRKLTRRVGELVSVIPGHRWRVAERASGVIVGDEDRLLQAWLALADNAAKYTPEGSLIEVGSSVADGMAKLWVRDHGPGIPPAARHRIFRRFSRVATRRDVGGSGLGLAIVDTIARAHEGACNVTDTPGGGATFTIQLPTHVGGASELPAPVRAGDVLSQREERE